MEMKHKNYTIKVFRDEGGCINMFGKFEEDERWEELSYNAPVQTMLSCFALTVEELEIANKRIEKVRAELEEWTKCLPIDCGCDGSYCSCNEPSSAMSTLEAFIDSAHEMIDTLDGRKDEN